MSETFSSQKLGSFLSQVNFAELPEDVKDKARQCLRDSIGCMLGAQKLPIGGMMRPFVSADIGINGDAVSSAAGSNAFAYATLMNALDFDDIYKKGHPGATVISAALAVGAEFGSSAEALIEAIVAGYEVGCRVGISLLQTQPRKLLHGHGTWQTLGAAAAAARLLNLDAVQAAHALSIAAANAPLASVMKTVYGVEPSMAKNNFGAAAQAGVNAALLAQKGFTGPLDIFDGESGFWRMFGADASDNSVLDITSGDFSEISEIGFKPYSCCRILQSSIEAALAAAKELGVVDPARQIASILVHGPDILTRPPFSTPCPKDMWAAEFSAPHTIAMALLGVKPGPQWFGPEQLNSPDAKRIAETIRLEPASVKNDTPTKVKAHHHRSTVRMTLRDGRQTQTTIDVARGEAQNPMSDVELRAKFIDLASGALGAVRAEKAALLFDAVNALPDVRSIITAVSV